MLLQFPGCTEAEAGMAAKSAEFRQRGGEVYLPVDGVVPAAEQEPVAAD